MEITTTSPSILFQASLGGLAGLVMEGFLHPIDTVRTRIKANIHETVPLLSQIKTMYRFEGTRSYFNGFSCTLIGAFSANTFYFYIYEKLKHVFNRRKVFGEDFRPFAAAFVGGILCNFVSLPFDVVRTRMQLKPGTYDYKHFFDGASKVLKKEGFRKLYLGGPAFFALNALEISLTFGFYELFYKTFEPFFPTNMEVNLPLSIVCSVTSAGLAGFIVNPLDVLVTRIQSVDTNKQGSCSVIKMARKIYKHEGFGGFMKGVSGTVSYYAMGALLLFPTYEILKNAFNVDLNKP